MTLRRPSVLLVAATGIAFAVSVAVFAALDTSAGGGHAEASAPTADARAVQADRYLQRLRETGDASYYARAEAVLHDARRTPGVLVSLGTLALARHDFRAALAHGARARRLAPTTVRPLGVVADAQIELGRYGDAARTLQTMVRRKPALASYARVSYFRELHGDLDGALHAMRRAVSAGGSRPENVAYVQTLLGDLQFTRGRIGAARTAYLRALYDLPRYPRALVGLARIDAARRRFTPAIARLRAVVDRLPLPEYVIALGETELAAGRGARGRADLALVDAQQRLLRANGVNTDAEIAVFEADHGSATRAIELARRSWHAAPSVRSADALGWALTRAGRPGEALPWARRALRLGSRDPLFLYHAGVAASRAGDTLAARRWLRASLSRNPRFSPLHAPRAAAVLRSLR